MKNMHGLHMYSIKEMVNKFSKFAKKISMALLHVQDSTGVRDNN